VSGGGAEFAVAIRSALLQPLPPSARGRGLLQPEQGGQLEQQQQPGQGQEAQHMLHLYAGVGVVSASDPASEWQVGKG